MQVGELFGELMLDDRAWTAGLTEAGQEMSRLSTNAGQSLDGLEADFDRAAREMHAAIARALQEMSDEYDETFRSASEGARSGAQRVAREMGQGIESGLGGAADAAGRTGREVGERFGGSVGDTGTPAMDKASTGLMGAFKGAGWAAAAAVVAEQLVTGLTAAMEAEVSGDLLAAQLGATAEESAEMGAIAGGLYAKAYGGSMSEVDQAIGAVRTSVKGMASASSDALKTATAYAMDFSKAFGSDVAESASVAGASISVGLARDAEHAFNLMTAASQRVPAALRGDLLDAVDEYGQFFGTLGFTGEQTFALLADSSTKSKYGIDKMGDSLKEFTLLSTDLGSSSVTDAYEAIGLNAEDMSRKILTGGASAQEAFQQIVSGLQGMEDPTARATAAIGLFGTPLEDLNKADIPEFLAQLSGVGAGLGDVTGKTEQLGQTMADNASTKLEAFKRGLETRVVGFIGGSVLPALEDLVDGLQLGGAAEALQGITGAISEQYGRIVESVRAWMSEHQAEITAAVATAKDALAGLGEAVSSFVDFAGALWELFGDDVLTFVVDRMKNVGEQVRGSLDVVTGLFQAAKGILTGDWSAAFSGLQQTTDGGMAVLGSIFDTGMSLVVTLLGGNWSTLKAEARDFWNVFVQDVRNGAQRVLDGVDWLRELPGRVGNHFAQMRESAVQKANELVDWVRGLPNRIVNSLGDLGSLLWQAGASVINGLIDGIKSAAGALKNALGSITASIPDWKGPPATDARLLVANGRLIMGSLLEGFRQGEPEVERYLTDLTDRLGTAPAGATARTRAEVGQQFDPATAWGDAPRDRGPLVVVEQQHNYASQSTDDVAADLWWRAQGGGG